MPGELSQEEVNALLGGANAENREKISKKPVNVRKLIYEVIGDPAANKKMGSDKFMQPLSQEEVNAMLLALDAKKKR